MPSSSSLPKPPWQLHVAGLLPVPSCVYTLPYHHCVDERVLCCCIKACACAQTKSRCESPRLGWVAAAVSATRAIQAVCFALPSTCTCGARCEWASLCAVYATCVPPHGRTGTVPCTAGPHLTSPTCTCIATTPCARASACLQARMAGVRQRRPTVYDFTVDTVDPPRRDARGIRENPGENIESSLVRPCKPRPVSLGAFHNNVLVVVLMGRNSELSKDHFTQLIHLEKKYQQRGAGRSSRPGTRRGAGAWPVSLTTSPLLRACKAQVSRC